MTGTTITPARAWQEMVEGNNRFIAGTPRHPRQDVDRRGELIGTQAPHATLFGCSDSRLAAEIIFDKGLGDLFVIRNAGQVISESVIGSLEYSVAVLGVPLIVVLGHDECGAVRAAIDSRSPDAPVISPHIQHLIEPIAVAVRDVAATLPSGEQPDATVVGQLHLRATIAEMVAGSDLISDAIAAGTLAIVGANYKLLEGRAVRDVIVGDIGES
ncbi:MAG TPA: carbonic anhydrase [Terrimesophilobacter sp.]|nr:carbonic anhydrase [Terrimesophilobacter sp.]